VPNDMGLPWYPGISYPPCPWGWNGMVVKEPCSLPPGTGYWSVLPLSDFADMNSSDFANLPL
jgi:hypothetical protein